MSSSDRFQPCDDYGYTEYPICQICGISFDVGRIRIPNEQADASWGPNKDFVDEESGLHCPATCSRIPVAITEGEDLQQVEHIAGPDCVAVGGYSGYRLSREEAEGIASWLVLHEKDDDWAPEEADTDLDIRSEHCFTTGVYDSRNGEIDIVKHGIRFPQGTNQPEEEIVQVQTGAFAHVANRGCPPVHPACLDIYCRVSAHLDGKVSLDGLYRLWQERGSPEYRFVRMPMRLDVHKVTEQLYVDYLTASPDVLADASTSYQCLPGTEYLAANPTTIPDLDKLLQSVTGHTDAPDVVFTRFSPPSPSDVFAQMPPSIRADILDHLSAKDVAALRHATRAFNVLSQRVFQQLLLSSKPYIWEINSLPAKRVNWFHLWNAIRAAEKKDESINSRWQQRTELYRKFLRHLLDEERAAVCPPGLSKEESDKIWRARVDKESNRMAASRRRATRAWEMVEKQLGDEGRIHEGLERYKGLKNRKRIWEDAEEILAMVEEWREVLFE